MNTTSHLAAIIHSDTPPFAQTSALRRNLGFVSEAGPPESLDASWNAAIALDAAMTEGFPPDTALNAAMRNPLASAGAAVAAETMTLLGNVSLDPQSLTCGSLRFQASEQAIFNHATFGAHEELSSLGFQDEEATALLLAAFRRQYSKQLCSLYQQETRSAVDFIESMSSLLMGLGRPWPSNLIPLDLVIGHFGTLQYLEGVDIHQRRPTRHAWLGREHFMGTQRPALCQWGLRSLLKIQNQWNPHCREPIPPLILKRIFAVDRLLTAVDAALQPSAPSCREAYLPLFALAESQALAGDVAEPPRRAAKPTRSM